MSICTKLSLKESTGGSRRIMENKDKLLLINYLANVQLEMSVATYSKVPLNWGESSFSPEFARFYFIKEGEGQVTLKGKQYRPLPGQLVLLPSRTEQGYGTISDNPFGKYWCHFTAMIGELNLFQLIELPVVLTVRDADADWLDRLFRSLIDRYSHKDGGITGALHITALLSELLAFYIENCDERQIKLAPAQAANKLHSILQHIEEHLADRLIIEELAGMLHLHPNYFINYFKSIIGLSPLQYIKKKRMDRAKWLLHTTDRAVSDICEDVGMQLFYFTRVFKNYTGFTPSEFRRSASSRYWDQDMFNK
jgi:AraC-like DNA-binding protein